MRDDSTRIRLRQRPLLALMAIVAGGYALRVLLTLHTRGNGFDLDSFELLRDVLHRAPLHVYSDVVDSAGTRWPYLPGFFGGVLVADKVSFHTGLDFRECIRFVLALGDVALACVVYWAMRRRGRPERALAGAALVSFGPAFVVIAGVHGQLDVLAWAPAAAALELWQRPPRAGRRAVWCGLLLALAVLLKPMTGLALLALLPSVRTRAEAVVLAGVSLALPLVLSLPWLLVDPRAVAEAWTHSGVVGLGGLGLAVQPSYATYWFSGNAGFEPSGAFDLLQDAAKFLVLVGVFGTLAVLWRRRTGPEESLLVLLLAFAVFGVNFVVPWIAWLAVALVIAGRFRALLALMAFALPPTLLTYGTFGRIPVSHALVYGLYVPFMIGLWALCALAWARAMRWAPTAPVATSRPG